MPVSSRNLTFKSVAWMSILVCLLSVLPIGALAEHKSQFSTISYFDVASIEPALAEQKSRLSGMVVNQTNKGIPGVVVIATNQVTRRVHRTKSGSSGEYSLNLPTGAYRITVGAPYAARFSRV